MVSSGMLCHVALVRTDVSVELSASFIRVTRIGELGTTLAVPSNRHGTRRNIPEDTILHSHRCENLKSYTRVTFKDTRILLWLLIIISK
jgi:predicted nucleic acid-binding Zn ribbon protein